jgi:hypothetical protein
MRALNMAEINYGIDDTHAHGPVESQAIHSDEHMPYGAGARDLMVTGEIASSHRPNIHAVPQAPVPTPAPAADADSTLVADGKKQGVRLHATADMNSGPRFS